MYVYFSNISISFLVTYYYIFLVVLTIPTPLLWVVLWRALKISRKNRSLKDSLAMLWQLVAISMVALIGGFILVGVDATLVKVITSPGGYLIIICTLNACSEFGTLLYPFDLLAFRLLVLLSFDYYLRYIILRCSKRYSGYQERKQRLPEYQETSRG